LKNIVIITSDAIRHNYFKVLFSQNENINILKTYVETDKSFVLREKAADKNAFGDKVAQHFAARHNTEFDFFSDVIEYCKDKSNSKYIDKKEINNIGIVNEIISLNPDMIVTFGCSIIKPPLIEAFTNRIINVHLGLSPYYFGSGTNFHCLVNNEFQFEGYTFMYMDEGIDTGNIIHQARAKIRPFDTPHQIGNRLIKNMTRDFINLINNFDLVGHKDSVISYLGKTYQTKDATDALTIKLYENFDNDAVDNYLKSEEELNKKFPIIEQEFLKGNET
jgi:phosphoribosylglycinamide formyltransferase 1